MLFKGPNVIYAMLNPYESFFHISFQLLVYLKQIL